MLNLVGVIIAFIIVIFLIRKKYNFGLSLILGSIIVALFSLQEISFIEIPKAYSKAFIYNFDKNIFDFQTIELAILLTLIYTLARTMQSTGAIDRVIKSLQTYFYKGGTLGVIPAVYGLMPVPGGALFSAPLIDKEGDKYKLDKDQKNFLNVWFRHIWFPIFPVSSAMMLIVSADFANIDIYELIAANMPAFFITIIIGLFFIRYFLGKIDKPKKAPKKNNQGLVFLLPPIIPVVLYVIVFAVLSAFNFGDIKNYQRLIFILGIVVSIFSLFFLLDINWKKYFNVLKKSFSLKLALAIIGIMFFRQLIDISKANEIIMQVIEKLPIHPIIIIIIIPLIMGLITGYNLGAIALSYFLVLPLFALTNINMIGLASLIFIGSLVGYLLSPIHLCNVVSSEHLKTDTTRMYKMYIPACLGLLIVQTVFILLFYR